MLTYARTGTSGCWATKDTERGAPMQYPITASPSAPDVSRTFRTTRGRSRVTHSSTVSPLSSSP